VWGAPPNHLAGAPALPAAPAPPRGAAAGAHAARTRAVRWLGERGAPVRRDEYFRYTDPAALVVQPPVPAAVGIPDEAPIYDAVDRVRLVFVDGVFSPEKSDAPVLDGVEITPLADVLRTDIHWARELFGTLEASGQTPVDRPLAALSTARATEGFAIRVAGRAAKAISFVYERSSETADALVRHLVRLDPGADLTLLENGPGAARINKVMEIEVGDDAALHHVRAQGRDHDRRAFTATFARLGARATLKSFTLTVNGRLTRNEAVIEMTGPDAVAHVAGACVGDGAHFLHDDTVFITHGAPGCESRQVFKKVLRQGATGVFQGKILVRPVAQKTDGYQISQGLLLDETSQFLVKPELEIYADDVKCSHGATAGAVDETALFYLTSRGIPRRTAEELLVLAFVDEAIAEIEDERIADVMRARLAGWLARRRG
jgi:Fe-S cluster assembly protein SufD